MSFQPVRMSLGQDQDGRLVFVDDVLVAVLVRLSALHGEAAGSWFLEAQFGLADGEGEQPVFPDLEAAQAWVLQRTPPRNASPGPDEPSPA